MLNSHGTNTTTNSHFAYNELILYCNGNVHIIYCIVLRGDSVIILLDKYSDNTNVTRNNILL